MGDTLNCRVGFGLSSWQYVFLVSERCIKWATLQTTEGVIDRNHDVGDALNCQIINDDLNCHVSDALNWHVSHALKCQVGDTLNF